MHVLKNGKLHMGHGRSLSLACDTTELIFLSDTTFLSTSKSASTVEEGKLVTARSHLGARHEDGCTENAHPQIKQKVLLIIRHKMRYFLMLLKSTKLAPDCGGYARFHFSGS